MVLVFLIAVLGFALLEVGMQVNAGAIQWSSLPNAFLPPLFLGITSASLHVFMRKRGMRVDQLILPITMLLLTIGLLMIWRLQGASGVWQQVLRGYLPGVLVIAVLILQPH